MASETQGQGGSVSEVLSVVDIEELPLSGYHRKTLRLLRDCRTSALGGHVDGCDACGHLQISYNSCRNRHCPKCQGHKREEWISAREQDLLPCTYFHVVFTLPQELNGLALHSPKEVYSALFDSAWATLRSFGMNRGIAMGMISILHTWGQNLSLHPHLHCIVPGGGVGAQGQWQPLRGNGKYLFSVKAMSKVFRAKYVAHLRSQGVAEESLLQGLFRQPWVVYAKRPFGGPRQVIEYLGRYTHKVAISNNRIREVTADRVIFRYKDYRQGGKNGELSLHPREFIRRFSQHILPKRFVRIRHYGILSSTWKRGKLQALQKQAGMVITPRPADVKTHLHRCPCCKEGRLVTILHFSGERGPPMLPKFTAQALVSAVN
jgi:hypothetical protein